MLTVQLKALSKLNLLNKKKIMVLDDWGPFDDGFEEISLTKGSEDEIKLWLADELQKKSIVRILDYVSVEELGRVLFQERQNINTPASLVKLPKDFYYRALLLIDNLKLKNDLEAIEQIRKARQLINEIISIRIRKIIQLAFLGISDQTILDRLTTEEILVYRNIKYTIEHTIGDIIGYTTS
ncbi:DNA replication complex GINS family protein [Sulfolobus sp. S-194]|uniref:DNA replication complex GINS family protein n=1 Tax=Sulfolobus sp. S-194 TaxID=2512240 RepID=UPI00143723F4|nr:DNA replication complex GINS family protein [Sulfolobus sp. S-194]QIW25304.1 DNA replication complex GINS family protein [Sulfolobus sp. S-194]